MNKNYYEILGVDKNATQDELKMAYRNLSKKYHPDRNPGDKSAEDKFKEVNEAYSTLSDENKRKEYDYMMSGGGRGGFNPFDMFRGGGFSSFGQMAANINVKMTISLEDAYYGCTHTVNVGGNRRINVDIPRGVTTGTILKFPGFGMMGRDFYGNDIKGDLIVTIVVNNTDKMWLNENGTLEVMYSVDWIDAILGGEGVIDLFDKKVVFTIPPFTQNGGYSIKGKCGFPKFKSDGYGNIKFNYIVKMPSKLTDEQIELIRKVKGAGK